MKKCLDSLCRSHTPGSSSKQLLTNDELVFFGEVIRRDLEVEWSRALANTSRDVVVGTVAGAEPAAKVTSLADWHTTQMRAHTYRIESASLPRFKSSVMSLSKSRAPESMLTQHYQPLRLLHTVIIGLGVS